jgi:hypothetical protein
LILLPYSYDAFLLAWTCVPFGLMAARRRGTWLTSAYLVVSLGAMLGYWIRNPAPVVLGLFLMGPGAAIAALRLMGQWALASIPRPRPR